MLFLLLLINSTGDTTSFYKVTQGFYHIYYQVHAIERLDLNSVIIYSEEPLKTNSSLVSDGSYILTSFEDGYGFHRAITSASWDLLSLTDISDMVYYPYYLSLLRICVAVPGKGVYYSINGGESWSDVDNDNLPDKNVHYCALSPTDTVESWLDYVYYAGGPNGVYKKSAKPWESWEKLPTVGLSDSSITDLFGAKDTNSVFAGTENGIFCYNDSDSLWIDISGNLPDSSISTIAVSPNTDSLIYVGTPSGLYYTNDFGNNWSGANLSDSVWAIKIASPETLYAGTQSGIYRSIDGGVSFSSINNNLYQLGPVPYVHRVHSIEALSPDTIVIGNEQGVYVSYNAGLIWRQDNNRIIKEVEDWMVDSVYTIFEESSPGDPMNGIYDILTNKLGNEPDVDGNGKIYLLLGDINGEDWPYDECASHFDPINQYPEEVVDTLFTPQHKTNYSEILYIDPIEFSSSMDELRKQFTHSFHQMLHWNYDADEEEWVKRGGDGYAEYLIEYGDGNTVPGTIYVSRGYLTNLNQNSLFTLYMFLYENYGGNGFIQDLIQSPYNGFEGLDSTLYANGYSTNHDTVFLDWEKSFVFDGLSLIDINYSPLIVIDDWNPEVFNEKAGYRNNVMKAESLNLATDSLFFNADDELSPYLMVIKCSPAGTTSSFITLDSYNEAFISLDDSVVYLFPLLTEAGDYLIDTKPWSFLPPRNLEVIRDYRRDTVELVWEEPEVRKGDTRHLLNYGLYRSVNDTTSFSLLTPVDTTFYLDNSVQNESTYYYYVRGVYESGVSPPSDTASGHPTQFPPPLSFRGMGGDSVVTLFWSIPDTGRKELMKNIKSSSDDRGLIGFRLYRRLISDAYFTQIESLYAGTYYNDIMVMNDTTYIYGICSIYESPDGVSPIIECQVSTISGGPTTVKESRAIRTGDLWTTVSNFGVFGDPNASSTGCSSYGWPGSEGIIYLYAGDIWLGARIGGTPYVSAYDGPDEFEPEGWEWIGPGKSDFDIVSAYHDWGAFNWGRGIGVKVIQRALSWADGPARHIIAYEFDVIYDQSQSDIGAPDTLDSFYLSIRFDADVSGADPTDPHIDDLVSYDGWTNGEWSSLSHYPSPSDDYTILQDTTLIIPDGVPDQICLFGDDPNEWTILGDTQQIWRDMSFILDGDNPDEIGNDSTDNGLSAGFFFGSMLYAPESPNDSLWLDINSDTCRLARPISHQWWNWNNDPGSDAERFAYMTGEHPMSFGYKFIPHPYDVGAEVFEYRFLLTYGPYSIANGDTLHFVLATGVGQGLNGGIDLGYGRGYLPGARQLSDYALMKYYQGAMHSDPYHPSSYKEDIHWNYDDTGIEEEILENKLILNNSIILNGTLLLELQLKERNRVEVEIYDKVGRCVKSIRDSFDRGKGSLVIPLHSLSSGVYFIRGEINGEVISREKVVLIR